MPAKNKIFAHVEMINGQSFLVAQLREGDDNIEIVRLPIATILMAYYKKHKLFNLVAATANIGTAIELTKHQGQEGKPVPYEKLPDKVRRFLKEAKKIEKTTEFGRLALSYFGKTK